MSYLFHGIINTPQSEGFIDSHCEVYVDDDAYFVYVETDPHEGCAMMTLPCAVEAHAVLGRAIQVAMERRAGRMTQPKEQSE